VPEGVRIQTVSKGSVAEVADLRIGDVVFEAAGTAIKQAADLRAAVEKTAPGTWLPLKVKRQNESVELIAKFPAPR
jgi:S1-C subfamily serine protease